MPTDRPRTWGKRQREGAAPLPRFRELTTQARIQRRREERLEKKERERTMAYFTSVQRALDAAAASAGAGDARALASIVDSFYVELLKLLRADRSLHLLRNGVVCRVIERVLGSSLLLHSKSLLYVLLGHMMELVTSPVTSYTLETLVASMSQALSALADEDPAALEAELVEGGPGMHAGSDLPSTATLLNSMAEELCEHAGNLLVHEVGSRALRSVILALGGLAIREAPPLSHPVRFPATLGRLATSLVTALEEGYGHECGSRDPAVAWLAAAQVPASSFIVQSLLRVSAEGSPADAAVRQRLESLRYEAQPLLAHLLRDPLGSHLFQAYLKVPTPEAVVEAGDVLALRQRAAGAATERLGVKHTQWLGLLDTDGGARSGAASERLDPGLLRSCCWGKALELLMGQLGSLLAEGSECLAQTGYVLIDLALYSPTATHLRLLWQEAIEPQLERLAETPALAGVLVALVRKCAFGAPPLEPPGAAVSAEDDALIRREQSQGVRYFAVPSAFQRLVGLTLCTLFKRKATKGAAHYLIVEAGAALGERRYDLARYLFHLHPTASFMLRRSLDKLCVEDVVALCRQRRGSMVLQQYLRSSTTRAEAKDEASNSNSTTTRGEVARFFRRLERRLPELVGDKHAAYVIETLYEVASIDLKEAVVKALVPIYEDLKSPPQPTPSVAAEDDASRCFIARKVLTRCCVEQYVHRRDDWLKMAQRQCQVQRLLRSMALVEV